MDDAATDDARYRRTLEQLLPYERIARQVIGLRMELGISQDELARRVGTSASAIARLESGQHHPSVETLRRVAGAMDRELVISFGEVRSPKRRKRETTAAEHPETHPVLV
jgi:transcriptional regulator with XRE-family HTH domain